MSRPIFAASAGSAYLDYFVGVTEAIATVLRTGDVPEPALVSIAEHRVTITPWQPGAPLTALLRWAEHLRNPVWSALVHAPLSPDARPLVTLYVEGELESLPAELQGGSWRAMPDVDHTVIGVRQPVSVAQVRHLAQAEHPFEAVPGDG